MKRNPAQTARSVFCLAWGMPGGASLTLRVDISTGKGETSGSPNWGFRDRIAHPSWRSLRWQVSFTTDSWI